MKQLLALISILIVLISCQKENNQNVITNDPPVADFTYSIQPSLPVTVQFTSPAASNYSSFVWDFGDGGFSFIVAPLHTYTSFGDFTVRLLQQSASGVRDTTFRTINTSIAGSNDPLSASIFNYFISMGAPVEVKFTNQSSNSNSYLWEFGDGATSTSGSDTLNHIYSLNGTYSVKLISTGIGGVDTLTRILSL